MAHIHYLGQTPQDKLFEICTKALPIGRPFEELTPLDFYSTLRTASLVVGEVTTLLIFDIRGGFQYTKEAVDFYIQVQKEIHAANLLTPTEFRNNFLAHNASRIDIHHV
jgi:hypothetical protein